MLSEKINFLRDTIDEVSGVLRDSRNRQGSRNDALPTTSKGRDGVEAFFGMRTRIGSAVGGDSGQGMEALRATTAARLSQLKETLTHVEADLHAVKRTVQNVADNQMRLQHEARQLRQSVVAISQQQEDLWSALQKRPTRSELESTLTAVTNPLQAVVGAQISSLAEDLASFQGSTTRRLDKFEAQQRAAEAQTESGAGLLSRETSLERMERRLEQRLDSLLERRIHVRLRGLEADLLERLAAENCRIHGEAAKTGKVDDAAHTGKDGMAERTSAGLDGSKPLDSSTEASDATSACEERTASNKGSGGRPVTTSDLEELRAHFGKQVRLVQNSLVSLRTQLRTLGREVRHGNAK